MIGFLNINGQIIFHISMGVIHNSSFLNDFI